MYQYTGTQFFFHDSRSASRLVLFTMIYNIPVNLKQTFCYKWLIMIKFIITTCNLITVTFKKKKKKLPNSCAGIFARELGMILLFKLHLFPKILVMKFKCRQSRSYVHYRIFEMQRDNTICMKYTYFFKVFMITTKCCQ